jgi:hypothetical protein
MMVFLLELQLVLWFVLEPHVEEMANVMCTTQQGFCLDLYRFVHLAFLGWYGFLDNGTCYIT